MKNKLITVGKILCVLYAVILLTGLSGTSDSYVWAKSSTITVSGLQKTIDGVLANQQKQAEVTGIQELIDTTLTNSAGVNSSDWSIIAFTRYRSEYNYENYQKALEAYAAGIKNAKATDYQRIALVYSAIKQNSEDIKRIIKDSTGHLGIMSYIYGLILLDSRAYSDKGNSREDIIAHILKLQLSDGGWALSGKISDIDVTAMALQSLAPYTKDDEVITAVNKSLALLSKRQLDTGDYKSWGTRCCESTAQVITALATLNIDMSKDQRFIKNKKSLLDGLFLYKHKDGSFSHTMDGRSDRTASVQAMYSLIAVWRQQKGLSAFYDFANTGWTVSSEAAGDTDQTKIGQTAKGDASSMQSNSRQTTVNSSGTQPAADQASTGITDKNQAVSDQTAKGHTSDSGAASDQTTTDQSATDKTTAAGQSTDGNTDNGQITVDQAASNQNSSNTASSAVDQSKTAVTINEAKVSQPVSQDGKAGTSVQSAAESQTAKRNAPMNHKMIITIVVLAAAALFLGIRYALKKQNRKLKVIVLAVAGILLAAVWGLKLQTVEDYYQTKQGNISSDTTTVLISIRCDTVAGRNKDIPKDGIILNTEELPMTEGDSVLDVLILAVKQKTIPLDYEGGDSDSLRSSYVNGIDNLYEDDFGDQSGWLYRVNGEFPGTACGEYKVKAGDVIEWLYTCDLGKDVGRQ